MKMNGARILVEELIHQGVRVVFGYPGGAVLDIYNELYLASDRIGHVLAAHEQGAAHAADGYARASGKTGVVLATSGPGATNLVTGIANAYLDSVPMVAITGNVAVNSLGKDSFQEVDIVGITQPVVKHNFMVRDIKDLQKTIIEAFEIANSGRKGPVLIDIPKNVQSAEYEYVEDLKVPSVVKKPRKSECGDIGEVVEMIKKAKKPFIYAGGGVVAAGAQKEVLELSKRVDAAIGLSMMGITSVPASYPLNLGMCGMHGKYPSIKAQSECDLLLAVGVRFSDRATGDLNEYTKKCMTVHIDIDRAEIGKNVSPDVSLWGDVKEILTKILEALPEERHPEWVSELEGYKNEMILPAPKPYGPEAIIEEVHAMTNSSAATVPSPSDLDENATMTVADALKIILANSYAVYLKTKNFHWHVSGPYFRDYHLLLDEQAAEILAATDAMAERARKTGNTTIRSIGDIARHQTIKDNDAEFVTPQDMLAELRADNLHMVESLRRAKEVADEAKDNATSGLIDTWTDEAERRAWFLFEVSR